MVIKSISSSKCSRVRSTLGSRNSAKYFRGLSIPPSHPTQPNSHIAIKMRLPWPPYQTLLLFWGSASDGMKAARGEVDDAELTVTVDSVKADDVNGGSSIRRDCKECEG